MYLLFLPRAKDQGRTKDEPRINQRTPKLKKVLLLRLPSFFLFLYLPSFCRPTTERTPREERINSLSKKVLFLKIDNLKRLTLFLKRLTNILKRLTQFLKTFPHFEVYFAIPPARKSPPLSKKNTSEATFICISTIFLLSLRAE